MPFTKRDILIAILTFLVGTLGSGFLLYVTTVKEITRTNTLLEALKNEVTIRNDNLTKTQDRQEGQITAIMATNKNQDKELRDLQIKLAKRRTP